jgi:two-component system OmpR family response regulator
MIGTKVLLVDDEEDFVNTLKARLEIRGLTADVAFDGESAVEQVRKKAYDAIILDLVMPGIDGIETLKRVLEINPDLQVILLTGRATIATGVEAVKKGAADFLEKPAEFETLLARIQHAATKRLVLIEQRGEEEIAQILLRRSW